MTVIAKSDVLDRAWAALLERVHGLARGPAAPAGSVVVLVPYAQLMGEAQRRWALSFPEGFAPRFETTRNWAGRIAPFVPQGDDLAQDTGRDTLTARSLLDRAGLQAQRELLAGPLLEAASQLAPAVAAVPPAARDAWAAQARLLLPPAGDGAVLRYEAAVARIALEWALATRHATDVLFEARVRASTAALIVLDGFQPDPLAHALRAHWGGACAGALPLWSPEVPAGGRPAQAIALHAASDAEDEAQRAAACVLAHRAQGRAPIALAAIDRALTRRIGALLLGRGLSVHDENGWTLSTTRAGAHAMAALRACARQASGDAVLDWLKHAPAAEAGAVRQTERWLRRSGLGDWGAAVRGAGLDGVAGPEPGVRAAAERLSTGPFSAPQAMVRQVEAWRESMQPARALPDWLAALRALLRSTGQWEWLLADGAGMRVLAELRMGEGLEEEWRALDAAGRPMSLPEFTHWVDEVLEAGRFRPRFEGGGTPDVVVVPLQQMLARPFAALVAAGCDEKRLQAAPEPPGPWTQAQRDGLGLPARAALEAAQRAAWAHALCAPAVDVLWRIGDEGGEPLLASPLVLALLASGRGRAAADPREGRDVALAPVPRPLPTGDALPVSQLSSTAYADLRHCPYRFFALRQLGLQESDELGAEVDKRDFGNWLHAVLQHFHEALRDAPVEDDGVRRALLDAAAEATLRAQRLSPAEFLPFMAGWPALRDGYLRWLAEHEAQGARFREAERRCAQPLGTLQLVGLLDRVDAVRAQAPGDEPATMVIDYKTESEAVTRRRIAAGTEDTQLAFYAALLGDDTLRAAYVNVGERGETRSFEQPDVVPLRDRLVEGILHDFKRIAEGAPMPALGEGAVCDYCAARGLCRKDFWHG
ncbi:ATP-dependent helicase/nuclease subunit B [Paracidovorax anthurii]|uniref:ATP-dependent helicase/nuclease subunit B n=1 Tax=Paracidovorax anthurii TaxID=78229 RepID=A0A328ZCH1_9BURK|nr:PD-(D/E)XK nuclease family protein [Paracidovorax anthurii]RAR83910.1 ATP-dependent helicase/nuclease subunit B [Paracidovorax anthurii]